MRDGKVFWVLEVIVGILDLLYRGVRIVSKEGLFAVWFLSI